MSDRPLRIVFDAHPLIGQKTGVGYYTDQLIRALATRHPEVEFVGYYHNFLYRKKTPNLPKGSNIRYRRIAYMPGQVVNLLRRFHIHMPIELLTLTRADFILYPNFLGHSSMFNTPSASVIHDLTFVDLPDYVSKRNLHDLQRFIPTQIARSSFLITVSEFAKKRIHEEFGAPLDDILVTLIPPEPPSPINPKANHAALKELGINGKYFLTLSTVEPRKNVLNALKAYLLLPQKLQDEYALVVTGKIGWNCEKEEALLRQLIVEGKNVIHVNYATHEQRPVLYQEATFYTSASHYEGFGMTPLEAMSYGKACALSDIPVFREVANDAVLYFDQNDPKSISSAWERLLTDRKLRERLAVAGKKQADSYNWDEVADSLYNRITKILGEKK